ncbi:MAG: GTPase domain-containing protein [Blastocatellia bacterium]
MEPISIIGGILAATGAGFGLGAGLRLLPVGLRAGRDLKRWRASDEAKSTGQIDDLLERTKKLARPDGRRRDSSIAGIYENALRHTDGSYTIGYAAEMLPTMLSADSVVEARCDELARMLAVEKPPGTLIQFRFSSGPDPGRAITAHLESRGDGSLTHIEASRLHAMNIDFYRAATEANAYRHGMLSVWVRVPVRQLNDATSQGLSAFIPAAGREIGRQGIAHFVRAIQSSYADTQNDGVIRRVMEDEAQAREQAEKVFRLVERECPISLRRFGREELWQAIYLGHRQDAITVPILPDMNGIDLRDYLCGESIAGDGWYIFHGSHPAAIVSMFVPPQPTISADVLRALTHHPGLTFRHTVVAEFIYLDQRKAVKRLDRRIRQIRRTHIRADGRQRETPEARAARFDLESVRDHIAGSREALIEARFYTVVYAEPACTRSELKASLRNLDQYCEQMVTAMQSIPGVEAAREEPASLRALYHRALVGEADAYPTGREITEVAHSLAALAPTESAWEGAKRPHTLCSTPSGRLIGLNFYDSALISSPLALVLGEPGSGKSTAMARVINDVLATMPEAQVRAVDFGESLAPHVDVVRGRHLRFNIEDKRTINIWDYPGLERGEMPNEAEISLVVIDAMKLARVRPDDNLAEDILTNVVTEVFKNEAPRNRRDGPKHEPTHSHLLALLETYPFPSQAVRERAATLQLALEKYRDHPWLDAPTHPDFAAESAYDVYELDSLDAFPQDVRETLASRVAARVVRSIGKLKPDGTRTPTLLVFDEVWKITAQYPEILRVIKKGARMGRKEAVVTMLATHAYEDFAGIHDITRTAGIKIIGKQIGDCSRLIADAGLSENAAAAVSAIKNVAGEYAQYVLTLGSGHDQIVEMIQIDLAPVELWTYTTNPYERNARARVIALKPEWALADVIAWLSIYYPRGLASAGLVGIDETLLA